MSLWKYALGVSLCVSISAGQAVVPAPAPAADTHAAAPQPAGRRPLRHLVVGESVEAVQKLAPAADSPFVVLSPGLGSFDVAELNQRLAANQNRVIDEQVLTNSAQIVEGFVRQNGFPIANVVVPTQNIADGVVRLIVMLGESAKSLADAKRPLRHLVIGESVEAVRNVVPTADSAFVLLSPTLGPFDAAEINKRLAAGGGRVIDERLLAAIAQVIENFIRQNGYPSASVIVPTQDFADGVARVIVALGTSAKSLAAAEWKIRKINMQGARWFSESLLREKLRIEQGGILRYSELDSAINWTNNNPFRRVRVHLEPVPNTGEADLTIAVQDALPLRLVASVDNGGNSVVGRNRYIAGLSYANLWGLDHQVSYNYITTNRPKYYQAHGLDYRVPLPWRHFLQLSGSYFRAQPEFLGGFFGQDAETITADLRYSVPLLTGDKSLEAYGALSFKQSNNNLTWDPTFWNIDVLSTKTDIFQFNVGLSSVLRDKRGAWALGASLIVSPGAINSRNTDRAFDAGNPRFGSGGDSVRFGARARYAYATISVQRLLNLGHGWDLMSRAVLQGSQSNLLPSEQLTIGGAASVRGFNESIFAGDQGFVFVNELMAPMWKKALPYISKRRGPLEGRFLAFLDMADVGVREPYTTDQPSYALVGAGVGVRMNLATNFALTADYGWQVSSLPYPQDDKSRAHIKASLSF